MKSRKHKCPKCDYSSNNRGAFVSHMRHNHPRYKQKVCENCHVHSYSFENHVYKECLNCNNFILLKKTKLADYLNKKFCSQRCSAIYNNEGRVSSKEQKEKTRKKLLKMSRA